MYAICGTTHSPTQVEHSIYCHFYNNNECNLVTAGATQLKIYRLINECDEQSSQQSSQTSQSQQNINAAKVRLECRQTFTLYGNIMSICKVSFVSSTRDSLLIALSDAKLSIVEYDPNTHDLKTLSLHYFEEDEMRCGFSHFSRVPIVRCDPESRCAAMLLYGKTIVVLPFRRDITSDEQENASTVATIAASASASSLPSYISKSPVMASYKLDLTSEQYSDKVNNIIDIQFLYNYYEPTLLILYEPVRTWAGRVAVRHDTFSMLVLSLDVHQRVHPHIWSISHLPYDCFQAMPVPRPVGGVLIFANNSVIHLNQGLPPFGVSLNSFNEGFTSFPLRTQEDIKISLDCSKACFISNDKLVISLKNGDIYVLTLFNDMTRSIRGFNFDKVASSVLPTCITYCEDGYIFLGSRLGHSLLLHYVEKPYEVIETDKNNIDIDIPNDSVVVEDLNPLEEPSKDSNEAKDSKQTSSDEENSDEPLNKRIKEEVEDEQENINNWVAGDVALMEDSDLLSVYGNQTVAVLQQIKQTQFSKNETPTTLVFEVCDSIINIGPCGRVCMGEPALLAEEFSNGEEPDLELVSTSGYAKNGALCVLQRTLRPQIVTTFELPGCTDMWTVYGPNSQKSPDESLNHAYLILSRQDATLILQTGQEINELDHSGFSSQTATVFAGNLGRNQYILQVSSMGVRLLDGVRELQHLPIDVGSSIFFTSLADPYAVLMSRSGIIILLCLKLDSIGSSARLVVSRPELSTAKSKIVAICVYKDVSGLFTTKRKSGNNSDVVNTSNLQNIKKEPATTTTTHFSSFVNTITVDDEDELLYGDSVTENVTKESVETQNPKQATSSGQIFSIKEYEPTYWLFLVRENGVLEIYSLPSFRLSYFIKNFPMGPKVLVDSVQSTDHTGAQQQQELPHSMPITREILVIGMGCKQTQPFLFARFDDELFVYKAFPFYESQVENHLKLRFRKFTSHNVFVKEPKCVSSAQTDAKESETPDTSSIPSSTVWLRHFNDISGYSGVFLCGPYPHWFFMTYRGELRIHEMSIDGPVTCFSPFQNVNCPKGFLYFNSSGELRICALATHLNYDSQWPVRKVPLRCTPHFVNYHVDSKTYCIVTSNLEEVTKIVRIGGEEKDYDVLERDSRYIYPMTEKFSLQLVSPLSWELIPGSKIELEEWEHVTCLKNVMLSFEGTTTGLKGFIALGTNYNYGEDVTNRGRIWILDIIEVVPEPGLPLTKNRIKIVYCKEQKGPITTLCQVKGLLLTAIGQKIYIWQLKESQLIGIAFIDTQLYIHTAISIKNFILIADVYKSISLLRYQEETRTLSLVSRDPRSLQVYACDYAIDNSQVCFVISDSEKNIILYSYQPEVRESVGGTRLLRRADYHFGSHINSFFRIRCKILSKSMDKRLKQTLLNRQITMFASLDGSIGYLLPVSEKTYRRLLMLHNVLTTSLQHNAGLNPKAFRMLKVQKPELMNPSKNILDGDLLSKYLTLSLNEKVEFAKKIGTTPAQITDDLKEIDRLIAYF